jgi:hypothetical protein
MFKIFKRGLGRSRDEENASDIVNVNVSDSSPILANRNYDLANNNNNNSSYNSTTVNNFVPSVHDLRRSTQDDDVAVSSSMRSLRTLPGVFCPVALSMCSVAVFMRIGFIVGNTGVLESFGLYLLAFSIFVLTGLSVCAISTNGAIQGGGVYCKKAFIRKKKHSFFLCEIKNLISF